MTIAEKLTKIAENEQKVYDAGYARGYDDGEIVGGGSYDEGFEDGKKAEYDAFWDAFQSDKGNPHNYQYTFCNYAWNDETFKPKYDLVFGIGYTGTNAFWGSHITNIAESLEKLGCKMDTTLCGYMSSMFQGSQTKRIPELNCQHAADYDAVYGFYGVFINSRVETIDRIIVPENLNYKDTFKGCENLKNIEFDGVIGQDINFQWSTKLKAASIESIINHLSDAATGKTLTLSLTAVDNAYGWYLPGGSFAGGSNSGVWSDLEASKPNWTINLV